MRRFRLPMLALLVTSSGLSGTAVGQDQPSSVPPGVPVVNAAPSPLLAIDQNRSSVVERIVADWGDALAQSGAGLSAQQLREVLSGLRADHLLAASLAGNLEGLRNVVAQSLTSNAEVKASLMQKALGDAGADLVYTPVAPCRLVDTRVAGGPIGTNSSRDFRVWVSSGGFGAQGGSGTNCGIPANPAAVVVNIAAALPQGAGNFMAYPTGTPTFTSVLNYQPGLDALSNGAIVPACASNCANQITIATNGAGADVVIDVMGYFRPPQQSGPACQNAGPAYSTQASVPNNGIVAVKAPACPVGYTITATQCYIQGNVQTDVFLLEMEPDAAGYGDCRWQNKTGTTIFPDSPPAPFVASSRCCRVY